MFTHPFPRCFTAIAAGSIILLAGSLPAPASGTYSGRPPQPRAEASSLNRELYALGQRIVTKKIELEPQKVDPAAQSAKLSELQPLLPKRVARKTSLPEFAGRLTPEQLEAVEYYVKNRYGK